MNGILYLVKIQTDSSTVHKIISANSEYDAKCKASYMITGEGFNGMTASVIVSKLNYKPTFEYVL